MRIHLTPEVIAKLRQANVPASVRQAVAALGANPRPSDARLISEEAGFYELFENGYWIIYQVVEGGLETITRIIDIEEN